MKKRLIALILAVMMTLSVLSVTAGAVGKTSLFADVTTADWFYDAVDYVNSNGLMTGTDKGFAPQAATTRAQIWAILARLDGEHYDRNTGDWYAGYQVWAIRNGISDGTDPNGKITRQQLAAMLYRYAIRMGFVATGFWADLSVFPDAGKVSDYAREAMQWAVGSGLLKGMDGKLNPQGTATRAQVATILQRMCEIWSLLPEKDITVILPVIRDTLSSDTSDATKPPVQGQPSQPSHTHSFNWTEKTENGHTGSCECGATMDEAHTFPETYTTDWSGEEPVNKKVCAICGYVSTVDNEPYLLTSVSDLLRLDAMVEANQTFFGKTVKLMADLDLAGSCFNGIGSQTPSFLFPSYCFNGVFDGNNKTISNMTLSNTNGNGASAGFFTGIGNNAQIKNLNFVNASIASTHYAGVVVGYSTSAAGTGVQQEPRAEISGCSVSGSSVTSRAHETSEGNFDDGDKAGGIVGLSYANIKNCSVKNTTIQAYRDLGGIVGYANGCTVSDCAVSGNTITIDKTHNYKGYTIDAQYDAGDIIGENDGATITVGGKTYLAEGVLKNTSGEYELTGAAGLFWFADQVNTKGKTFNGETLKLMGNVDLQNAAWTPVGQNKVGYTTSGTVREFYGTFDGQNYTISNVKIVGLSMDKVAAADAADTPDVKIYSVGFFGYLNGTVKNITFKNVTVTGHHNVGVVAGYADSPAVFNNCHVDGATVTCSHYNDDYCGDKAGGIAGYVNSLIVNCSVKNVQIAAGRDAGQMIGCANDGSLNPGTNCTATNTTVTRDTTQTCTGANLNNELVGRFASE